MTCPTGKLLFDDILICLDRIQADQYIDGILEKFEFMY